MSAWRWPRPDVVPLVVTTIRTDGTSQYRYCDLRAGRERAETIELPDGTRVKIERPVRVRIDLSQHRARRTTPHPPRPSWRDDSWLVMGWRAWRAGRDARRASENAARCEEGR